LKRQRLEIGRQPLHLLRAHEVARLAGRGVALEEDEPTHLEVADECADLLVALDLGASEAHEEEVGDGQGRLGRGALDRRRSRAALEDDDQQ
jgi:hypothetical protein